MYRQHILRAFLVAPLVPVAWFVVIVSVATLVLGLLNPDSRHAAVGGTFIGAIIYGPLAVAVSYAIALVLGIPAYFLTKLTVGINHASVLVMAGLCGMVGSIFLVAIMFPGAIFEFWYIHLVAGLLGTMAGRTFWKMAGSPSNLSLQADRMSAAEPGR